MKRFLPALRALASLLLLWLLYRRVPLEDLKGILSSVRSVPFLVVFVLSFLNTTLSAWKWQCFLGAAGIRVPLRSLVATYLTGAFFNLFLPGNIGGDVYRVHDVRRSTGRGFDSLASVFADRLSGLLALAALGLLFSVGGIRFLPDPRVVWIPAAFCAAILTAVWAMWARTPFRVAERLFRLDRVPAVSRASGRFLEAFRIYSGSPRLAAQVMALSFAFQFSIIFSIWMMSRALSLDIPFLYFCVFVPVISVLEALPISIFGLGVRDASYVFFFGQVGVPRVEALSLAVLYVVFSVLYGAMGGIVFAVRRRRAQPPPASERPA